MRGEEREESRGIGLLKLAQHLRDEGGPFLGEADVANGLPNATIVATSALVSVDQLVVETNLLDSQPVVNTILVEVSFHGDVDAVDW